MANFIAPEKQYNFKNSLKVGFRRFKIARYYFWLAIFLLLSITSWQFILAQAEIPMTINLGQSSSAQNILVNSSGNYLERFVFNNNSQEMVRFTTIWFSRDASSSLNGSSLKNYYLYDNENGINIAGPQPFSSSVDGVYFQNLNWQVGPLLTKSLSLVADVDSAVDDSLKIKFDLDLNRSVFSGQDSGNPVTVTPNPSKVDGVWLTAKYPKVSLVKNSLSPLGLKATPLSKDVTFLMFNLLVNDAENVYLRELRVKLKNSSVDNLTTVKITNESGTQLASQTVESGNIVFTFSNVELSAGSENKFYLKADVNELSKVSLGSKPYFSIETSGDVILQGKSSAVYAKVSGFINGNEVEIISSAPVQKLFELKFEKKLESEDKILPSSSYITNALSYENGVSTSALRLNNSAGYLDYSCSGNFDNNNGTLEMWLKFDQIKGADQHFWETDNGFFSLQYDYESQGDNQKKIKALIGGQNLNYVFQTATSSDAWKNSEWKHLALTWSNELSQANLYVNGVKSATTSYAGSIMCTNFRLLNDHTTLARGFTHGAIDEFKLYNYTRTDNQILGDYTGYSYVYSSPSVDENSNNQNQEDTQSNSQTSVGTVANTDTDSDGLPDSLENLYGTDKNKSDSDLDGYNDLLEINGCYNPVGSGRNCDDNLVNRLLGRILLAVEGKGEAFYVSPTTRKAYYLGRAQDAYNLMRKFGLGAKNSDLQKIPTDSENFSGDLRLRKRLAGRILLQVEGKGEAWYISPVNLKRYYLGTAEDAYQLMRRLGLGITNSNLRKIPMLIN